MAKGLGKALGFIAAGMGQGYAGGAMKDVMNRREEVLDDLRAKRAAQENQQDRDFRMQETEKGRGFDREMFGEKMEWEKEKFGMEQTADEKKFAMQMKLKQAGDGEKEAASIKEAKSLAEKTFGPEYTNEQFMQVYDKYNAPRGGGDEQSSYMTRAMELEKLAAAEEGREVSSRNVLDNLKKFNSGSSDDSAKDTYKDVQDELKSMDDVLNPRYSEFRDKSPEEKMKLATDTVVTRRKAFGMPVSASLQESEREAPQGQALEAPATSTQGDQPTDATPIGEGTERSPFIVETEAQKQWALQYAPKGSFIAYKGQVRQKPKE